MTDVLEFTPFDEAYDVLRLWLHKQMCASKDLNIHQIAKKHNISWRFNVIWTNNI